MKPRVRKEIAIGTQCRPIFLIGHYRSGTTWLTNILEAHPDIYTPTHAECNGQCESAFFSSLLPYCSWGRTKQDRIALRAIFECSDYWHHMFGEDLPSIDAVGQSPASYFRECMDIAARRRSCSHWLEKTPPHTLLLKYLLESFPDAIFIAVDRNNTDVVRSYMYLSPVERSTLDWAKRAFMVEVYRKVVSRYGAAVMKVRYEDLVVDKTATLNSLYEHMGLECPEADENAWSPNSSFGSKKPEVLLRRRVVMKLVSWLVKPFPSAWCEWFGLRRFNDPTNITLPGWMFRVFRGLHTAPRPADGERVQ